ncbi:MAG: HAMP domain-containing histidine kinase [Actinobacteria bacterium]|nr:HAMP domain-containing histidine kinase [Actinomycetota bacterium]
MYTASHDLRSPLISTRWRLGALIEDLADGDMEQVRGHAAAMDASCDTMARLLNDLLELSRIGRVIAPPEKVSLNELVRGVLDLLTGQISTKNVTVEIAPGLPVLFGDLGRLAEVMQNLVENAIKYMGDQAEPRIEIGARRSGDEVVCYVCDNGIGIDPRYHEKIFDLFDQLDNSSEGTGVGLALVKRIIEVHGGRVWVESEGEGKGSTFYFALPSKHPVKMEAT